jgi:dihydroorotate dehydrogenase (NAD+) catalytic subunit
VTSVANRVDLGTTIAGTRLDNPLLIASGCGGTGRELARYVDLATLGGFVTATVRRDPTEGARGPRLVETASGLLGSTGFPGPGVAAVLADDLPWLLHHGIRPIVSIAGASLGETADLARRVGQAVGVAAIELVLHWPGAGETAGLRDPLLAARAVSVVRREAATEVPVLVKLGPAAGDLVALARSVVDGGADALVVSGSPAGLALDAATLRPQLGALTGALSGPAIRTVTLHAVWQVSAALPDVPLIGVGGVTTGQDALELLAAGACAVQVGTAVIHDPTAPARILTELGTALEGHGFTRASDAVRIAHRT